MVERIYSLLDAFRDDLRTFWDSSVGIWVLVLLLLAGLYFVAISKVSELIVGGL